jgi:PKD repeat protein
MKTSLIVLLLLLAFNTNAADIVTIDTSLGRYDVTTVTGDYYDHEPLLKEQVWWDNEALAYEFLEAARGYEKIGYPNTGFNESPYFAYNDSFASSEVEVIYWVEATPGAEGCNPSDPDTCNIFIDTISNNCYFDVDGSLCVWAVASKVLQANSNGPYNGMTGLPVTFSGSDSTDSSGSAILTYDWDFGDGNTDTGETTSHTYATASAYTVTLTVTNDSGDIDTEETTAEIVVAPQPPIAGPLRPYSGLAGDSIAFDGSNSIDPDGGNITAWDWDFGDGNTGTGETPSHIYDTTGDYTVSLVVIDEEGEQSTLVRTTATIVDAFQPPIADPGGPYEAASASQVTFDGSNSSDPDGGDIVTWNWDFGDGNTGTGETPSHSYANPGSYNISLQVIDDEGEKSAIELTTATIQTAANVGEDDSGGGSDGACFIATAAYGSYMEPHVLSLRRFRDERLMPHRLGRQFVSLYYQYSPPVAQRIQDSPSLRLLTRLSLTPLVFAVQYPVAATISFFTMLITALWFRRHIRTGRMAV